MSPNEPRVNIEHFARQARSEKRKKLFQIFSIQGASEIVVASMVRWEEYLRVLIVLERELKEASEILSEKQVLLATVLEDKMSMQKVAPEKYQEKIFEESKELEEQKAKEALELLGRKHKLVKLEKEWIEQGCCTGWRCQGL